MSDPYAVPEQALRAFERLTGLNATVHDLAGTLVPFLPPERFIHTHPLCTAVKVCHAAACVDFGVHRMNREIADQPDGRVQVCFAGLVEFVVPVFMKKTLAWVLFAGPRTPGKRLHRAVRDTQPPPRPKPWPKSAKLPAPVDDDEAQAILEQLRQLAARLRLWALDLEWSGAPVPSPKAYAFPDDFAQRRAAVRRFVHHRHAAPVKLADLAEFLKLSESRAAHAVKEVTGQTFVALLTEARLRSAAGLLRHTSLAVPDVALRSGFNDLSHFHRAFKKRFATTPHRYRKEAAENA